MKLARTRNRMQRRFPYSSLLPLTSRIQTIFARNVFNLPGNIISTSFRHMIKLLQIRTSIWTSFVEIHTIELFQIHRSNFSSSPERAFKFLLIAQIYMIDFTSAIKEWWTLQQLSAANSLSPALIITQIDQYLPQYGTLALFPPLSQLHSLIPN